MVSQEVFLGVKSPLRTYGQM